MKNMEMISATALMSPINTNANAMTHVAKDARTGSCSGPRPLFNQSLMPSGKMPSAAMACSVRGATMMEPSAELMAAAANPTGMMGPQSAMFSMYSSSVASASSGADHQSLIATAM